VEQRREVRKAMAARVRFGWTNPKGAHASTQGMLEDISPGGASMRVKESVEAGSRLDVEWGVRSFSGTVRYCKSSGMEFILGIQKDERPA
jgi:hypothetical protein